jgi:hypothetical protein
VLDDVLPRLPAPRRNALERALLVVDATAGAVDSRALGLAVRDALVVLAEQRPPVVAIDDLQWLDAASTGALAFAVRRLGASSVSVLLTRRVDVAQRSELERALPEADIQRLRPFSVGALHAFLRNRLRRVFARQTLLRIHDQSGGNPFYALELARALGPEIDPTRPLPVPESLDDLVRGRLSGLPPATHEALALAAAVGTAPESLLERAGITPEALAPALDAGVITRERGAIRFTHPLLASAVYDPSVHRRLASVVDDPLARARHLALAAEAPDAEVATVLEEAALTAAERGAPAVAAELAEQALRLTPPSDRADHGRRALAAVRAQHRAGEWTRAKTIAEGLLAESDIGPLRAEALVALAELESLERASALLEEALHETAARPALQARIHCDLAGATRFTKGFVGALDHARAALALADEVNDDVLRVEALNMVALLGGAVGDPDAPAHAQRAYELACAAGDARLQAMSVPFDAFELGGVDEARALLERDYRATKEQDELAAGTILYVLSWVELLAGHWPLAADYAAQAYEIAIQYGLEAPWNHVPIAAIAVHRGQLDLARAHSERGLRLGEEQIGLHTPVHLGTMGVIELQSGDLDKAAKWFAEAEASTTRLGWRGPGHRWWLGDHVETLLALDQVDDAVRLLDGWGRRCAAIPIRPRARPRHALPWAGRGRGKRCRRGRIAPRGCGRAARGSRRHLWPGAGTARPRRRPQAQAAEARCPRCDRVGSPRFRAARRRRVDREGTVGARPDRWTHPRARIDRRRTARRGARLRGADEQGGRRCALRGRANGRDAPLPRLCQARRSLTGRARTHLRARGAKFRGTHDFKLSPAA